VEIVDQIGQVRPMLGGLLRLFANGR